MELSVLRQKFRPQILEIAKDCEIDNVRVFGSVVHGTNKEGSDIDFLVHAKPHSGFKLGGFKWKVEELLGCQVDVVIENSIHWSIKDSILQDAVEL